MKHEISPIAYPTSSDEEYRWGFDKVAPSGQPMAWIHDWDGVSPGFEISEEEAGMALAYEIPRIGDIPVGQILATHSLFMKLYWHTTMAMVANVSGQEKAEEIAARVGSAFGLVTWNRERPGSANMELSEIAWRLDAASLFSGSWNKNYSWADDQKVVTASTSDYLRPPTGLEATADLYEIADAEIVKVCLATAPGLKSASGLFADADRPTRRMRVWTYDGSLLEDLGTGWTINQIESLEV